MRLSVFLFFIVIYGMSFFLNSCKPENPIIITDLSGEAWTFHEKGKNEILPAKVPGSVHMDLLANGEIPDPYYRTNEKELQWIGERDWVYETDFSVNPRVLSRDHVEIVFKGLDTRAEVYLNDSLVLEVNNFFREWRIDAKQLLKREGNKLKIVFSSPVKINREKRKNDKIPLGWDYVYTRKPAYHFGWDWGPVFITAGIWKPVRIEAWKRARILNLQIIQEQLSEKEAKLSMVYEIEADKNIEVILEIQCLNTGKKESKKFDLTPGVNTIKIPFEIKNPKLWWSNGLGEPYLYKFAAHLVIDGVVVDQTDERIGLRTLKLVQKPDSLGKSFYFELNGMAVFMKGANYIPQDLFLNRTTEEDYKRVIKNTVDANMNMLRVWGGGFYEKDIFYDLCDENGILVWQDFMFACAMYPGDDDFLENVRAEVGQNVKRLRNHPSIALWCGNNENYIGWKDWGWSKRYSKKDSAKVWHDYEKLYGQLIPDVLHELDPGRFYWPSSPLFGWGYPVNSGGDVHYWGVWHAQEPFENFQKDEFIGRFMSEYGFQGCPEMSSVNKFTLPEDHDIKSEVMLTHQKHRIGYPVIDKYMKWYYHKPKNFEAYLYVSQVQQAFGIGMAFEAHRRAMPFCMGTLYWQINDCYPVTSWSSVDVYGKWKALHYKARNLFKQIMVSPFVKDKNLDIYVVSDKPEPVNAQLDLKLYDFTGNLVKEIQEEILVKPNSSHVYYSSPVDEFLEGNKMQDVVLVTRVLKEDEEIAVNDFFFVVPKNLNLPESNISVESKRILKGYELTFTSDAFAKDVFLSTGDGEGFFTNNFFDIVPGVPVKLVFEIKKDNFDPDKDLKIYSLIDSYK